MVKDAVAAYPVFSFMALRFTCAALVLLPFVLLRQAFAGRRGRGGDGEKGRRGEGERVSLSSCLLVPPSRCLLVSLSPAPALIGLALFAGYAFQTAGLRLTTPAKAGFITGLSVVIVPLAAALVLRLSPGKAAWAGVSLATAGLALLSLHGDLTVAPGDALVLGCAVAFAAHILLTGRFSPRYDPLWLTFGQVVTVAILSGLAAVVFDRPAGLARAAGWQRPLHGRPPGRCRRGSRVHGDLRHLGGLCGPNDGPALHQQHPHRPHLRRRAGLRRHLQLSSDR